MMASAANASRQLTMCGTATTTLRVAGVRAQVVAVAASERWVNPAEDELERALDVLQAPIDVAAADEVAPIAADLSE